MPKYESQFTGTEIDERLGKIPQMEDDITNLKQNGGGGGIIAETDPTVPAWAKQPTKPSYTAEEVGALPSDTVIPEEVYIGDTEPTDENIKIFIDTSEEDLKLSDFENDMGYITEDDLPEIPEAPQADWSQNDPTAADYVKNRTHWAEPNETITAPEQTVALEEGQGFSSDFLESFFLLNDNYEVSYNGTVYNCVCFEFSGIGAIGNPIACGGEDNGLPFFMMIIDEGLALMDLSGAESVVLKILHKGEIVHKIPAKFVDFPDFVISFANDNGNVILTSHTVDEVFDAYYAGKKLTAKISVLGDNVGDVQYLYAPLSVFVDETTGDGTEVIAMAFRSFTFFTDEVVTLTLQEDGTIIYNTTKFAMA